VLGQDGNVFVVGIRIIGDRILREVPYITLLECSKTQTIKAHIHKQ
jgi:hypothetical protein